MRPSLIRHSLIRRKFNQGLLPTCATSGNGKARSTPRTPIVYPVPLSKTGEPSMHDHDAESRDSGSTSSRGDSKPAKRKRPGGDSTAGPAAGSPRSGGLNGQEPAGRRIGAEGSQGTYQSGREAKGLTPFPEDGMGGWVRRVDVNVRRERGGKGQGIPVDERQQRGTERAPSLGPILPESDPSPADAIRPLGRGEVAATPLPPSESPMSPSTSYSSPSPGRTASGDLNWEEAGWPLLVRWQASQHRATRR